jgi:hypothetical protein
MLVMSTLGSEPLVASGWFIRWVDLKTNDSRLKWHPQFHMHSGLALRDIPLRVLPDERGLD